MESQEFNLASQLETDSHILGNLPLCRLLLMDDQQFPWFVLVPQRANITEIYQLDQADQQQFWLESTALSQAIMTYYCGDKLNVAALGNIVSQLHLHHIVRYKTDLCWPAPIWGKLPMIRYESQKVTEIGLKMAELLPLLQAR